MDRDDKRWRTSIESKQREKYETNQIHQNIGGKPGLRGIVGHSRCTDHHNDNEHRPRNRHDNDPANDHQFGREYRHLQPGLGLLHVPNSLGCGARTLLLHEGYDRGRSRRSGCHFVGNPSRYPGYRLLFNSGRPGRRAQSSVDPASACRCH